MRSRRRVRYDGGVTQTKLPRKTDALESVVAWRRETLERSGYPPELADDIASADVDLHRAVDLLSAGCSPELAAQILL